MATDENSNRNPQPDPSAPESGSLSEQQTPDQGNPADAYFGNEFNQTGAARPGGGAESGKDLRNAEEEAGSGSGGGSGAVEPEQIANQESSAEQKSERWADTPEGKEHDKKGFFRDDSEIDGKKKRSKKLLIGLGLGGGGIFIVLCVILFILSALEIPNFVENIFNWQFARTTRILMEETGNITSEKIAVESSENGVYKTYEQAFGKSTIWAKMFGPVGFNVNKEIKNLGTGAPLFKYKPASVLDKALGRDNGRLVSVVINGKDIAVKPFLQDSPVIQSTFGHIVPGFNLANKVSFGRQFVPELQQSFRMNETGFIARMTVSKELRQRLGISLFAWVASKYTGKTPAQAEAQVTQDAYEKISANENKTGIPDTTNGEDDESKKAQQEAAEAEKDAVKNHADDVVNSNGATPSAALDAAEKAFTANNIVNVSKSVAKFLSGGVWTAMTGICMIWNGSLKEAGPTIDANSASDIRTFNYVASADSEAKVDGNRPGSTEAQQGLSTKLNGHGIDNNQNGTANQTDLRSSVAEQVADGQKVSIPPGNGPQSSSFGQYSIADSLLPPGVAGVADKLGQYCPGVTSLWTGAALAGANIGLLVAGFFTGGSSDVVQGAVKGAGEAPVDTTVTSITANVVDRLATSVGWLSKGGRFTGRLARDTAIFGGVVGGLTLLAKLNVMTRANALQSGIQQGKPFADNAWVGGSLEAQDTNRQMYMHPLTNEELAKSDASDQQTLVTMNQQRSPFERYLALDNTQSLLNHIGSTIQLRLNGNIFASLLSSIGSIFSPTTMASTIFNPFTHTASAAAVNSTAATNAGIIQWGYNSEEENLLQNDPTFKPLENQEILDRSGQSDAIEAKYGKCWDPTQESMGTMISKGDVNRNHDGGVNDKDGLCSPYNLSSDNPEFGHYMIFRYEIAHGYSNSKNSGTLDEHVGTAYPEGD